MVPVAPGIIKLLWMPSPFQMPSPHQLLVGYHWVFANITSYVTARPVPRKHEAFLNRRRPSSPSVTEENDEIKTKVKENFPNENNKKKQKRILNMKLKIRFPISSKRLQMLQMPK